MTDIRPRRRLAPAARRAEILEAATTLVAARGFNGVTLGEIAEACGLTNPGLLHYFPSKNDLLIAVLDRRDNLDYAWGFAAPPEGSENGPAQSRAALTRVVERNVEQRELIQLYTVLSAEALDPQHPAHDYFDRRLTESRQALADLVREWHPSPDAFALQVLSFMDGAQLNWLRDPRVDLLAVWNGFADLLFAER